MLVQVKHSQSTKMKVDDKRGTQKDKEAPRKPMSAHPMINWLHNVEKGTESML